MRQTTVKSENRLHVGGFVEIYVFLRLNSRQRTDGELQL